MEWRRISRKLIDNAHSSEIETSYGVLYVHDLRHQISRFYYKQMLLVKTFEIQKKCANIGNTISSNVHCCDLKARIAFMMRPDYPLKLRAVV